MSKSAREMFADLGYEEDWDNEYGIRYSNEEDDSYIYFYRYWQTIEVLHDITIKELKAINQQIKELGWLDE